MFDQPAILAIVRIRLGDIRYKQNTQNTTNGMLIPTQNEHARAHSFVCRLLACSPCYTRKNRHRDGVIEKDRNTRMKKGKEGKEQSIHESENERI